MWKSVLFGFVVLVRPGRVFVSLWPQWHQQQTRCSAFCIFIPPPNKVGGGILESSFPLSVCLFVCFFGGTHWGLYKMTLIFQTTFSSTFCWRKMILIYLKISLKFVVKRLIDKYWKLTQIMACRLFGAKSSQVKSNTFYCHTQMVNHTSHNDHNNKLSTCIWQRGMKEALLIGPSYKGFDFLIY